MALPLYHPDRLSLEFDHSSLEIGMHTRLHALWQAFRRTALEPCQSLSPDLISFADECLICARISLNGHLPDQEEEAPAEEPGDCGLQLGAQDSYSATPPQATPPQPECHLVGLVYLFPSPANPSAGPAGEANIGVIIDERARRYGYAHRAVQIVLGWAFDQLGFHRVQAAIIDTPFRDSALRLFIGSGFTHEGTKRRAVYQPEGDGMAGVWKDVTYVAMLDTEWTLKSRWRSQNLGRERPAISVWDEMFTRHTREREELLKWEEKHGRMKKSLSSETLRETLPNPEVAYLTDDASSVYGSSRDVSSSPPSRPTIAIWDDDSEMGDAPGIDELRQQRAFDGVSLQPPALDRILSLPSIPSPTRFSEDNPQSPVTIQSDATPRSSPPSSPSPSPSPSARSFVHTSWSDSEDEWLHNGTVSPPFYLAHHPYPAVAEGPSRPRRISASPSSDDSWSDARSSIGDESSSWDVLSDTSDYDPFADA